MRRGAGRLVARSAALAGLLLVAALHVQAQAAPRAPKRPKFDRDAELHDPHDWRSYMECAQMAKTYTQAHACLYWASRLDPARPEPRYGEWWLSEYTDTTALRSALVLDPFVYEGRVIFIGARTPGLFTKPDARGRSALGAGNYFSASAAFAEQLSLKPNDLDARWGLAVALYYRALYDSSAAQLRLLEEQVQRRQREHLEPHYQSTALVDYMEAAAFLAGGRRDSARVSLQRALAENLAFYPAHMQLAELDVEAGDTASAALHWADARQLYGTDVVARRRYALFLLRTGRPADAETELRAVLAAEPDWVDAHADLARAIDAQGDARRTDAVRALEDYLSRAPAEPPEPRKLAKSRLDALRGA